MYDIVIKRYWGLEGAQKLAKGGTQPTLPPCAYALVLPWQTLVSASDVSSHINKAEKYNINLAQRTFFFLVIYLLHI